MGGSDFAHARYFCSSCPTVRVLGTERHVSNGRPASHHSNEPFSGLSHCLQSHLQSCFHKVLAMKVITIEPPRSARDLLSQWGVAVCLASGAVLVSAGIVWAIFALASTGYQPVRDSHNGSAFRTPVADMALWIDGFIGSIFICRTRTWLIPWFLMALFSTLLPVVANSGPMESMNAVVPLTNLKVAPAPSFATVCAAIAFFAIRVFDRIDD